MRLNRQLIIACFIFFIIGWIAAVLGPALPDLAFQTQTNLTTIGGIISALFVGALLAQLMGGALHDHWGIRPLLTIGLACMVVGVAGIIFSHNIAIMLFAAIITGLGHGAVDIGISLFVALSFGDRSVAALNFTNIFFGLGAVAGPAVAAITLQSLHTTLPSIWIIGGITMVTLVAVALMPLPKTEPKEHAQEEQISTFSYRAMSRTSGLWLFGGIFLLYVGLENGLSGWTAEFHHRVTGQPLATGALVAASFWFALTIGRVFGTFLGARLTPQRLLQVCLAGLVAGATLFFISSFQGILIIVATILIGLSCGPIYPTAVVMTTLRFPQAPGRATSIVTSLGSAGGILIPLLQGWLLTRVSSWSSALLIVLVSVSMVAIVQSFHQPKQTIEAQQLVAS